MEEHGSSAEGFCFQCLKEGKYTRQSTQNTQNHANEDGAWVEMGQEASAHVHEQCQHPGEQIISYACPTVATDVLQYLTEYQIAAPHEPYELEVAVDVVCGAFYRHAEAVPFASPLELMNALKHKDIGNEVIQKNILEIEE